MDKRTRLDIEFSYKGDRGCVSVSCVPDDALAALGKDEDARGFPVCIATIDYEGQGCRALFGWVQLVRSTDNAVDGTAIQMDPLRFFEDSPAPYCWYGLVPTLFDAPSRDERKPLVWLAHSFLAMTPGDMGADRQVVPLLGFSWGFEIDAGGRITLVLFPQHNFSAADWAAHIPYLSASYPTWRVSSARRVHAVSADSCPAGQRA